MKKPILILTLTLIISACQPADDIESTKVTDVFTTAIALPEGIVPLDMRLEFRFTVNDVEAPDLRYMTITAPDSLETDNGDPLVRKYTIARNGTVKNGQRYYTLYADFDRAELDMQGARSLPIHGWSVKTEDVNGGLDKKDFSLIVTNGIAIASNSRILYPSDASRVTDPEGLYISLFEFPTIENVQVNDSEIIVETMLNDNSASEVQIFFGSDLVDGEREAVGNVLFLESEGFDMSEGLKEITIPIENIEFDEGYSKTTDIGAVIFYVLDTGNVTTGAPAYFSQLGTRSEEYLVLP